MSKVKGLFGRRWKTIVTGAIVALLLALASPIGISINSPPQDNGLQTLEIGQHQVVITIGTAAYAAGIADYVSNGVQDDVQLQAALDALPSVGGKLVVLAGTYNFTATVSRAIDNVTIEGVGLATSYSYNGSSPIFSAGSQSNWVFRDFATDAGGINVATATDWSMQNVKLDTDYYAYRTVNAGFKANGVFYLVEKAAAGADVAGEGKIWVKDATPNTLYFTDDAGTDHAILTGATGIKHEFFVPFEEPTGQVGNWDVVSINASQDTHFTFQVAESFESLINARIIMIPDTTETIQWDIYVSVSAGGEAYNNDDRSGIDLQVAVTVDLLTEVDVSAQLNGLEAGDYVAIDYQSDTANLRIIGFEFDYN